MAFLVDVNNFALFDGEIEEILSGCFVGVFEDEVFELQLVS